MQTDLLSRQDYAGIAASMSYPANAWINGKYTPARSGDEFTSTNPATGENGLWSPDCICVSDTTGGAYDCLGVLNGNNLPGTPCWIPGTNFIGTWDANCTCSEGKK